MKKIIATVVLLVICATTFSQVTVFEKSNGTRSATYFQAIQFYRNLDNSSPKISMRTMGQTDAGYPLHLVLVSNDGKFDPAVWHKQNKVIILINNGIHAGEPDGIDASLMLVRDIVNNKFMLPDNIALAFIPVYNIGGALNRNSFSRVNQNGPEEYGFRGNSQNLDLNRDFTKNDSRESRSFAEIFHFLDPDIFMDNHVSDGADYQHTMTLITTQYDKLGEKLGAWVKNIFDPALYKRMSAKNWDMVPYVDFASTNINDGMEQFYEQPRYSSGYAALFQTIAYVPETHMLKPYADRVKSTYALMQTMIEQSSIRSTELLTVRRNAIKEICTKTKFPLLWNLDTTKFSMITFKGYEQAFKTSDATGLQRMYYDHSKPFMRQIKYFNVYGAANLINKPKAYIIPQGWHDVIDRLKVNGVKMQQLKNDSVIDVEAYHIDDYKSAPKAYEKHHKNYDVKVSAAMQKIKFLKGDFIIFTDQRANRYLVEMLEPTGDDSFFAWNSFDAVLQQKEGYSDYRWEDIAAEVLRSNSALQQQLNERRQTDTSFAKSSSMQLNFIYKHSPYYEPAHLRYPVYRLL